MPPPTLRANLRRRLEGAERVAVLAVGSRLRGDDAAGLLAAEALEKASLPADARGRLAVFLGETAPENLTGAIRRFAPSHIIVIDAAHLGKRPGTAEIIPAERLEDASSFCTHRLPLSLLAAYLCESIGCEVIVIGIQAGACAFGSELSRAVAVAAERVAGAVAGARTRLPRSTRR